MQQTERYKLNLIERDDAFSPEPLNGTTQLMEEALRIAHMGAVEEHRVHADLESRVTVLEAKRMVVGNYRGDGTNSRVIELGFTPVAVVIAGLSNLLNHYTIIATADKVSTTGVTVVPGGFSVAQVGKDISYNGSTYEFNFIAFG